MLLTNLVSEIQIHSIKQIFAETSLVLTMIGSACLSVDQYVKLLSICYCDEFCLKCIAWCFFRSLAIF